MKRFWIATGMVLAASVVLEIAFHHLAHAELPWHEIPAFDLAYGLAGTAFLFLVSKKAVGRLLQRPESYWEDRS